MKAIDLMDSRKFMAAMDRLVMLWNEHSEVMDASDGPKAEALQAVLDMANPDGAEAPLDGSMIELRKAKGNPKAYAIMRPKVVMDEVAAAFGKSLAGMHEATVMTEPKPKRKYTKRAKPDQLEAQPKPRKRPKDDDDEGEESQEDIKKGNFKFTAAQLKKEAAKIDAIQAGRPTEMEVIRRAVREVIKPNFSSRQPSPDGFRHFLVDLERHGESLSTNGWKEALRAEGVPCGIVEFGQIVINPDPKPRQIDVKVM